LDTFQPGRPRHRQLTTYTNRDLAAKALEHGAEDYLLKPIEIKKLEDKVRSILTGKIPTR
jgi:DNA-binding response OmpR family regulator